MSAFSPFLVILTLAGSSWAETSTKPEDVVGSFWTAGVGLRECFREPWMVDGVRVQGGHDRGWWRIEAVLFASPTVRRSTPEDREDAENAMGDFAQAEPFFTPYEMDLFTAGVALGIGVPRNAEGTWLQVRPRAFAGPELRRLRRLWLGATSVDESVEYTWTVDQDWWTVSPSLGLGLALHTGGRLTTILSLMDRIRWTVTPDTCRYQFPNEACGQTVTTWVEHDFTLTLDVVAAL
jgi:hypothetical protein